MLWWLSLRYQKHSNVTPMLCRWQMCARAGPAAGLNGQLPRQTPQNKFYPVEDLAKHSANMQTRSLQQCSYTSAYGFCNLADTYPERLGIIIETLLMPGCQVVKCHYLNIVRTPNYWWLQAYSNKGWKKKLLIHIYLGSDCLQSGCTCAPLCVCVCVFVCVCGSIANYQYINPIRTVKYDDTTITQHILDE